MESNSSRPMPGQPNTVSINADPARMKPRLKPITVITGAAALRSAWPISTARSPAPRARAARMNSAPSTSSIAVRVMRAISAR